VTVSEALAELPGAIANGLHAQEVDEACRGGGAL
jgi:hypothetical protein